MCSFCLSSMQSGFVVSFCFCLVGLFYLAGISPQNKVSANWKQQQHCGSDTAQIQLKAMCHWEGCSGTLQSPSSTRRHHVPLPSSPGSTATPLQASHTEQLLQKSSIAQRCSVHVREAQSQEVAGKIFWVFLRKIVISFHLYTCF